MHYADETCATFDNMLATLDHLASRAQADGRSDDILGAKLAEDMFPLENQFRIAINQVLLAINRLCGMEEPLDEEPYASLTQIRERLTSVRALVAAARSSDWSAPESAVDYTLPNGMRFVMTAAEYIRDWTMPNFYFHTSIAYALLRHGGLSIGKADLIPHMLRYAKQPEA